jgi:hypothetical protein
VRDILEKLVAEKKVSRMHFRRVNFVLVCPPVEKIIVAQRSVHHLCVARESKTEFFEVQLRALAGSQHRNHPKNVITCCDRYRNRKSMAPNTWSVGKKDHSSFL